MPKEEKKSEGKEKAKSEPKKGDEKKKPEEEKPKDAIKHRVRVAGVILDGSKEVTQALRNIKGIGMQVSRSITRSIGIPKGTKLGDLSEDDIKKVEGAIQDLEKNLPPWMLNRQKDYVTGKDMHLVGPELEISIREGMIRQQKARSYKGTRYSLNLPVRGQRTRSTGRHGSTVGVQRKKQEAKQTKAK